ncbi:MAG: hypothetical protein KC422_14310 [Trueperaceae bacterium]|nr:hypothetical protein [Trueperaceae bacterium]
MPTAQTGKSGPHAGETDAAVDSTVVKQRIRAHFEYQQKLKEWKVKATEARASKKD